MNLQVSAFPQITALSGQCVGRVAPRMREYLHVPACSPVVRSMVCVVCVVITLFLLNFFMYTYEKVLEKRLRNDANDASKKLHVHFTQNRGRNGGGKLDQYRVQDTVAPVFSHWVFAWRTSLPQLNRNFSPSDSDPKPVPPYSLLLVKTKVPVRPSEHCSLPLPDTNDVGRTSVPLQATPDWLWMCRVPSPHMAADASPMKLSLLPENWPTTGDVCAHPASRETNAAICRGLRICMAWCPGRWGTGLTITAWRFVVQLRNAPMHTRAGARYRRPSGRSCSPACMAAGVTAWA